MNRAFRVVGLDLACRANESREAWWRPEERALMKKRPKVLRRPTEESKEDRKLQDCNLRFQNQKVVII